jgi:hypothetical protein
MYRILSWFLFQLNFIINIKLSIFYYGYHFFTFQKCYWFINVLLLCRSSWSVSCLSCLWCCCLVYSGFEVPIQLRDALKQTCSSTSHLNVSFAYVGVHAVYAVLKSWVK